MTFSCFFLQAPPQIMLRALSKGLIISGQCWSGIWACFAPERLLVAGRGIASLHRERRVPSAQACSHPYLTQVISPQPALCPSNSASATTSCVRYYLPNSGNKSLIKEGVTYAEPPTSWSNHVSELMWVSIRWVNLPHHTQGLPMIAFQWKLIEFSLPEFIFSYVYVAQNLLAQILPFPCKAPKCRPQPEALYSQCLDVTVLVKSPLPPNHPPQR